MNRQDFRLKIAAAYRRTSSLRSFVWRVEIKTQLKKDCNDASTTFADHGQNVNMPGYDSIGQDSRHHPFAAVTRRSEACSLTCVGELGFDFPGQKSSTLTSIFHGG